MNAFEERMAEHKADLDEEWHDVFDTLTGQGYSPSGVKATIGYVTTERTQSDVANEFDISDVTIRNLQAAVVALGPVDRITRGGKSPNHRSAMDICTNLADRLGWEKGTEYNVSRSYSGDSPQPRILKQGWQSLYEELIADE